MSNNTTTKRTGKFDSFSDEELAIYATQDANAKIARHFWGDVILDGCTVTGYIYADVDDDGFGCTAHFPTKKIAREVAKACKTEEETRKFLGR